VITRTRLAMISSVSSVREILGMPNYTVSRHMLAEGFRMRHAFLTNIDIRQKQKTYLYVQDSYDCCLRVFKMKDTAHSHKNLV